MTNKKRPAGYWQDWNNVERELKIVIEEVEHFPTQKELSKMRRSDISRAISRHHGGLVAVQEKIGYERKTLPRGYWESMHNVITEARRVAAEYGGRLPSTKILQRDGYSSLLNGATAHHGGINKVRMWLGQKVEKASKGHWDEWERVATELRTVAQKLGQFPSQHELAELKRNDLAIAVSRKHEGLLATRKRLGFPDPEERPEGYWQDWTNFEREARIVIDQVGRLPTKKDSRRMGLSSMYTAVYAYHGGAAKVRDRLGLSPLNRKPNRHWRDVENVKKELHKIMQKRKLENVPGLTDLNEWGYRGLATAICTYHEGIQNVRKLMGYENDRREAGYWDDQETALDEARKFKKENGLERLPCAEKMQEMGYGSLVSAIVHHCGGFVKFRTLLEEESPQRQKGVWKDGDYTLREVQTIMHEEGWSKLPHADVLNKKGYGGLSNAITKYHGGFRVFRQKLDEYLGRESDGARLERMLEEYAGGSYE